MVAALKGLVYFEYFINLFILVNMELSQDNHDKCVFECFPSRRHSLFWTLFPKRSLTICIKFWVAAV